MNDDTIMTAIEQPDRDTEYQREVWATSPADWEVDGDRVRIPRLGETWDFGVALRIGWAGPHADACGLGRGPMFAWKHSLGASPDFRVPEDVFGSLLERLGERREDVYVFTA